MHVKIAEKASSKWQKMQTTLSRNCCSKNAPKLSAVIHCLQWITAKIALKMQWDFGHSGNLQNLQGNCLQCRKGEDKGINNENLTFICLLEGMGFCLQVPGYTTNLFPFGAMHRFWP